MATAQRVFYETVSVLVFLVLLIAAWVVSGQRAERRLAAAHEEQSQVLSRRAEEHRAALRRLENEERAATEASRHREAEAVFRGYAAGLQPAAVEGWRRYLSASRDALKQSDGAVAFLHLVTPSGFVLTSTDADLLTRGRLDEESAWVLTVETITSRDGDGGMLELAGPILAAGQPVAYLWLGYDVGSVGE